MKKVKDFVAIDFETLKSEATDGKEYNHLPIQLGMVKYIDGNPVEECINTYIDPPVNKPWKHHCYWKIKIDSSLCEGAPSYDNLHSEIIDFIGELPIIAFNDSSDWEALIDGCKFYNLTLPFGKERFIDPYCHFLCNYEYPIPLSKNMSGLERWVRGFDLWREEWKAHCAIDDATMTAELYLYLQTINVENTLKPKSTLKEKKEPCFSHKKMDVPQIVASEYTDKLAGKSIVISGVFAHHSRDEYKDMIEKNGGKNVGSISKKTTFILAGENMGPSKLEKAEKLGIPIINEDEFLKMLE